MRLISFFAISGGERQFVAKNKNSCHSCFDSKKNSIISFTYFFFFISFKLAVAYCLNVRKFLHKQLLMKTHDVNS